VYCQDAGTLALSAVMTAEKVCVIGGCGHVGLPLAVLNAAAGRPTVIYDVNQRSVELVRSGKAPFFEEGLAELLAKVVESGYLTVSDQPEVIADARYVVLVVGTPVDRYLNPDIESLFAAVRYCRPHLRTGQLLVLRSTVYPGVSRKLQDYLSDSGLEVDVAFCPERIAQGRALIETGSLPQIISAFSERGLADAREFFAPIAPEILTLEPLEAELAKLFTNAYRYIEFASVNQFYMIAETQGVNYERIAHAIKHRYPRLAHMPGPGFAAGPCLLKDTMQLAAFYNRQCSLGHAALWINEGLPDFIVARLKKDYPLHTMTVGILGMAFKADNDDRRDSLSYKLRKLLRLEAKRTLCHDPMVPDPDLQPRDVVIDESDVLIIGAPHREYRSLDLPSSKVVVDIWGCLPQDRGTLRP